MESVLGWPQLCHLESAALYSPTMHLSRQRVGDEVELPEVVVATTSATRCFKVCQKQGQRLVMYAFLVVGTWGISFLTSLYKCRETMGHCHQCSGVTL